MKVNYKELLEDVKEITKDTIIVQSIIDIKKTNNGFYTKVKKGEYWLLLGNIDNEIEILDFFNNHCYDVDKEGEYFVECVLRYIPEYEYGPGYFECKFINIEYLVSFKQRERDNKLQEVFNELFVNKNI